MNTHELFDLVAPIAITGAADIMFMPKAVKAWARVQQVPDTDWTKNHCPPLGEHRSLAITDDADFYVIYGWSYDAYGALFEQIVAEHGPAGLGKGCDYWGAKGFKFPGQSSRRFELAGDACGHYPWYETAELLIKRLAKIAVPV